MTKLNFNEIINTLEETFKNTEITFIKSTENALKFSFQKGDFKFFYELSQTFTDSKDKKALPYIWYKRGWTSKIINNYLVLHDYIYLPNGDCISTPKTNPTIKDGLGHYVINFKQLKEPTLKNIINLIKLTYKKAVAFTASTKAC